MIPELTGYTDRLSAAPGDTIRFMVSTDQPTYEAAIVRVIHADPNPAGPGYKEEVINTPVNKQYAGRKQTAYSGSYIQVEHHPALTDVSGLTLAAWIYPTMTKGEKGGWQGIISKWSKGNAGYNMNLTQSRGLSFTMGDGNGHAETLLGKPMHSHQWYFVAVTWEPGENRVTLYQKSLVERPPDFSDEIATDDVFRMRQMGVSQSPLLIGAGYPETVSPDRVVGRHTFNGKIDRPRVFNRALTAAEIEELRKGSETVAADALVGAWDFAGDFDSARVTDTGPYQLHGTAVNMPMRAVTGHNWDTTEFDFRKTPEQYGAIHFHEDDLEDAKWQPDFEWTVPDGLKSGFYAARLRAGDQEDTIPFFIRPRKGKPTAKALYLIPTMTYLAYANDRMPSFDQHAAGISSHPVTKDPLDLYLAEHPELAGSIYDHHSDGSGVAYSTRLRPIVTLRYKYHFWIVDSPRHLAADTYLADWMEHEGIAYDVATDEDLHFEGESLLSQYSVVLTGTHPEYWTTPMTNALEHYLARGGRMMYLGGNGFYWVTSVDPNRPHLVEVRRGVGGTRAWNSAPGEAFHSTTGEMGALWRHRGKTPNQLAGIAFTAQGWQGTAGYYVRQPGSFDPRAAFIFDGVDKDEVIGNFGLSLGGAAGDELDRVDFELGTPPHTLVLATSTGHDKFILPAIENVTEISAAVVMGRTELVHADMVYFETPNNGAVFSTGSITWCSALSHNHYDNNVSRITGNVLRRFLEGGKSG
jgi:N,N-dimethylformamidase beta subunit-like protein/concanavalin A-like lectin/glucanase superfamily protein